MRLDTSGRPGPSSAMSTRWPRGRRGEDVQLTSEMTRMRLGHPRSEQS